MGKFEIYGQPSTKLERRLCCLDILNDDFLRELQVPDRRLPAKRLYCGVATLVFGIARQIQENQRNYSTFKSLCYIQ